MKTATRTSAIQPNAGARLLGAGAGGGATLAGVPLCW